MNYTRLEGRVVPWREFVEGDKQGESCPSPRKR